MSTPDETPTEPRPAKWVGSAPIRAPWEDPGPTRRAGQDPGPTRRAWDDGDPTRMPRRDAAPVERTLDLPAHERVPPPPPPPAPPKPPKGKARYQPPPPGPPKPWPPVREGWEPPSLRRRRRRKWPWVLLVMVLACGGCCGVVYRWGKQYYDQYPSAADTGATVTGLATVDDATATKGAEGLRAAFDSDQLDEARFTAVYADRTNGRARITVFGTTRFITDPKKALTSGVQKLTPKLELTGVRDVDAGSLGGEEQCGAGRYSGKTVSVCVWADHGSMGGAVFAGRGIATSGPLLQTIRQSIIRRQSY
jgi:hypothetical protein